MENFSFSNPSGGKPEEALDVFVFVVNVLLAGAMWRMPDKHDVQDPAYHARLRKEAAAEQCKYPGGSIPYGFKVNKATKMFEVDDDEAENVRMAFYMVAGGATVEEALRCLDKIGARNRNGNVFAKFALIKMLRNEQYNGVYVYNKRSPLVKQTRIPGGMPRIVDEQIFYAVQAVLDA